MKRISVAIPAYEMHGKGPGFLADTFERLLRQTFRDFEVVVSDNAADESIKEVCGRYAGRLDIRYARNEGPRTMAANINNSIRHSSGEIIKFLFLDDFLLRDDSLALIAGNFDVARDQWLATGCVHTKNGMTFFDEHVPRWNDRMHLGKNTIGSPSVLAIRNQEPLLFDPDLMWLVDCDYYRKCYDTYGPPRLVAAPAVAIRIGDHQTTHSTATAHVRRRERDMLIRRYENGLSRAFHLLASAIRYTIERVQR